MTTKTLIGWSTATVTDIQNIMVSGRNMLKFIVDVDDQSGNYIASQLVEPTLIPGKNLYRWLRVCGIPLSAVDDSIRPALFRGKKLRVKLVVSGAYFNIADFKTLEAT